MFDTKSERKAMEAVIERFESELKKIRTGRAHPDMPLNQVANVTISDATMLLITPFDPSNIANINAAIRADSTLGLNPSDDGRVIRVPIPPLTEERRKEIVKTTSSKVEEAKVGIRKVREDARNDLKAAELPEDAKKRAEKEIEDLTKEFTDKIEKLFKEKEAEIMKI